MLPDLWSDRISPVAVPSTSGTVLSWADNGCPQFLQRGSAFITQAYQERRGTLLAGPQDFESLVILPQFIVASTTDLRLEGY